MEDRVVRLQGIHNFREYGNYAVAGGGRLRPGILFRSAQHAGATQADLATVVDLKLATVVDLRSPEEREASPCPRGAGFSANVLRIGDMSQKAAPHLAISADLRTVEDVHAAMLASYRAMPFSPSLVEGLRAYFASAADTPGPHLVHCMAGKDRTGLAVAMLHKATGVHVDDMMADYLLTNTVGHAEARIAAGARVVRKTFPHIKDEGVRALMNVDAAYLDAAFDAIRDRYDSFADYLGDILGVDDDRRKQLVGRLVG